ncbi:hypothetical protein C2845_PM13G24000 [Panicum miliaceum]|uniref:Disease resistance protein RGA3 n=1 Tax=Panicum miliaceum TaxID=4540 RepID=A0A3L6RIM6_PANMI|nr:hypothetical protein C2845_PM13G24000 [Panicum miliaceum]
MCGVDDDRRDLELKLLYVQSLLADAEAKAEAETEAGRAVRAWMRELRAAAYQADDVLDDFQYEALHREAQSLRSSTSKVKDFFSSRNRLVFRHKASRELKNVLGKIDKLVKDMQKFGLLQREPEVPQAPNRQTHSALDESAEIFGRDDDKAAAVKLLLDQQDQRSVQVLPIIGMGGLGKTTLAKMVYNDCTIQEHFELRMWHCVSENFEATAVVRSVIELASNGRCNLPDTMELLLQRLQEVIGRKRFLLILDDVWNEDQLKWDDDLKPLLCSSIGGLGSMIVVTSRSQKVASIMGTLPPRELACLSEEDSWELFSKKAFCKGVEEQEEFITVGKLIVNKCKGLPLALKTMGGLMSSKHQIKEWEAIAESNRGGNNEVLSILKLSYMHLSSEMKQCFVFCAVFPKDYEMDKDKLIQLWTANNFIQAEEYTDLVQKAEFVFNELAWRSFIQDVNVKINPVDLSYEGTECKMHDLAKDITDECAFAEELIQHKASVNNVRHMQLQWDESDEITGLMKSSLSLRTLLVQSEFSLVQKSKHMDLKELKLTLVRAICCPNPYVIHNLINATHLRYLDLSGSEMVRLPDSICMLYNLQSLRLNGCQELEFLPEGMQTMRQLTHIYLLRCNSLKQMPPKLSLLHNLCTLTKFIVGIGDGFGVEELKDLRQLRNRLELFNLRRVKSGSKANLHEKKNLTELFLYWGRDVRYKPLQDEVVSNNPEEVMESLVPHAELKILELHGYGGLAISQWMRDPQMFCCLRELRISNCPRCKDLPLVWLSSPVEKLHLSYMNSLTTLCKNIDVQAAGYSTSQEIFPKLKMMTLAVLPVFERWAENSAEEPNSLVMFPQLEELYINDCDKIATLPEAPALTSASCYGESAECIGPMSMEWGSFPSLIHLKFGMLVNVVMPVKDHQNQSQRPPHTLRSLDLEGDNGFISMFNSSKLQLGLGDCLASVEHLEILLCDNIVRWPVEEFRCLVRLQSLGIFSCRNLEGRGSSSEEFLPLPQLKRLDIGRCGSLLEVPKLAAALGELFIGECKSLVALPSNLGDLAKLRHLRLVCCSELKALPDRMDGLTSLERLSIGWCPGIKKFPQGLLQRLPALKSLRIHGCPDLQRLCREGGEYFGLVSLIPDKDIPPPDEPETKEKTVKSRLLSWCVGGSSSS